MYELLITNFAEQDLEGVVEYIAVKLANPPAAGTFLDNVEACYGRWRRRDAAASPLTCAN